MTINAPIKIKKNLFKTEKRNQPRIFATSGRKKKEKGKR